MKKTVKKLKTVKLGKGLTLNVSKVILEDGTEKLRFSFRKNGKLIKDRNKFTYLLWVHRDVLFKIFNPDHEDDGPDWETSWKDD